jgi:hypothetical protein
LRQIGELALLHNLQLEGQDKQYLLLSVELAKYTYEAGQASKHTLLCKANGARQELHWL